MKFKKQSTESTPLIHPDAKPWKILVVDDEEEVHATTRFSIKHIIFDGRPLELLHAYSGEEAKKMAQEHNNLALIFMDVVMESTHAGLEAIQYIRNELKNKSTRIILRTGQPGVMPTEKVILEYDINDYKTKTDLTYEKLFASVVTSLRNYRDIRSIEQTKQGMEKIIAATRTLFEADSVETFITGALQQLTSIMYFEDDALLLHGSSGFLQQKDGDGIVALAGSGKYSETKNENITKLFSDDRLSKIEQVIQQKTHCCEENFCILFLGDKDVTEASLLYVECERPLNEKELALLHVYADNLVFAIHNIFRLEKNFKE